MRIGIQSLRIRRCRQGAGRVESVRPDGVARAAVIALLLGLLLTPTGLLVHELDHALHQPDVSCVLCAVAPAAGHAVAPTVSADLAARHQPIGIAPVATPHCYHAASCTARAPPPSSPLKL